MEILLDVIQWHSYTQVLNIPIYDCALSGRQYVDHPGRRTGQPYVDATTSRVPKLLKPPRGFGPGGPAKNLQTPDPNLLSLFTVLQRVIFNHVAFCVYGICSRGSKKQKATLCGPKLFHSPSF